MPIARSSATASGASRTRTSTAAASQSPAPAAIVSAACCSVESSGSATAAMPPCAHAVALSSAAPGGGTDLDHALDRTTRALGDRRRHVDLEDPLLQRCQEVRRRDRLHVLA